MSAKKKFSPRTVRNSLSLPRTCKDVSEGWILVEDGRVTIAQQQRGEPLKGSITLSRRAFSTMVDFYNADQESK